MDASGEGLVKIFVELADDAPYGSESFWARPLGSDEYELRNSPWFAYDLHFADVVRAVPDAPGERPRVIGVVRQSGHKTLRVVFPDTTAEPERLDMLRSLRLWRAFHENCNGVLYAVDVEPDGDCGAVCDQLRAWEQAGRLEYETGATQDDADC